MSRRTVYAEKGNRYRNLFLLSIAVVSLIFLFFSGPIYSGTRSSSIGTVQKKDSNITPSGSTMNYVPVLITNTQAVATQNPYDQMVRVNSSYYSSLEESNLGNVQWYTVNGQVIPSWIQSGDSSTSDSTVYWLKMPVSVAADSSVEVYLEFESKSVNLLNSNGYEGAYPTATSVYGQYDNGNLVFLMYNNFKSSSLPQGWIATNNGEGGVQIGNGLVLSVNVSGNFNQYVYYNSKLDPSSYVVSASVASTSVNYANGIFWSPYSQPSKHAGRANIVSGVLERIGGNSMVYINNELNGSDFNVPIYGPTISGKYYALSVMWYGTNLSYGEVNDSHRVKNTAQTSVIGNSYFGFATGNEGTLLVHWVSLQIPPPDDIMPSVVFEKNSTVQTPHPTPIPLLLNLDTNSLVDKVLVAIPIGIILASLVLIIEAMKRRKYK